MTQLKKKIILLVGHIGHKSEDCTDCRKLALAAADKVLQHIVESGNTGITIEELRKELK